MASFANGQYCPGGPEPWLREEAAGAPWVKLFGLMLLLLFSFFFFGIFWLVGWLVGWVGHCLFVLFGRSVGWWAGGWGGSERELTGNEKENHIF